MKKIVIILLAICIILPSCAPHTDNEPDEPSSDPTENTETIYKDISDAVSASECVVYDLGIPYIEQFPNDTDDNKAARAVWDMQIFDGKLFIAAGDYIKDKGPLVLMAYNFTGEKYTEYGTLDDEQICKFKIIDNTLFIPGTDPKGYPYYGSIYTLDAGEEEIKAQKTVPEGVNCFDICKSNGLLFAATGTDIGGTCPVCISSDWGKSFEQIYFKKDGAIINKNFLSDRDSAFNGRCRSFNIFEYSGKVFCTFDIKDSDEYDGLYVYDKNENCFVYYSDISEIFGNTVNCRYLIHNGNMIVCDTKEVYILNRSLSDYTLPVGFRENERKYDMLEKDGVLYILTSEKSDDGYIIRLRKISKYNEEPDTVCSFIYTCPIMSMDYYGGSFYLGVAYDESTVSDDCGRILKIIINTQN